mgnify:FL=1
MNIIALLILMAVLAVITTLTVLASRRGEFQRRLYACNIAEGVHDCAVSRVADAAITSRHLLYKKGAADNSITVAGASDWPLGTVDDEITAEEISGGVQVAVQLLGKGPTKRMVASGVIGAGVTVYAAASGKVAATGTVVVGTSLTAASADGDVIEVADCIPVIVTPKQ